MTMDWRAALDHALAEYGTDLDSLLETAESGSLVHSCLAREPLLCPTPAEYLALSDLTQIDVEVLTGEVEPAATLAVAMRTRGQTAPQTTLERSVTLLRVARAVLRLEPYAATLRSLKSLQSHFSGPPARNWDAKNAGRAAALRLRAYLDLGTDPLLDLRGLVESLGVPVELTTDLPEGLHGVTSWTQTRDGWVATIAINANDLWTVQRYTLAHEFCHVVHEDRPKDLTTEYGSSDRIASDPGEVRAESFATHLLAPRAGLASHWGEAGLVSLPDGVSVAKVMWEWGMSREAVCYALEDCPSIPWTGQQTEEIRQLNLLQMVRDAGLERDWATMTATQNIWEPSVWLTEATAELFMSSRLPVENYAVVTNQEVSAAVDQLLAIG
jgi:IrrE N-terminal-like domain